MGIFRAPRGCTSRARTPLSAPRLPAPLASLAPSRLLPHASRPPSLRSVMPLAEAKGAPSLARGIAALPARGRGLRLRSASAPSPPLRLRPAPSRRLPLRFSPRCARKRRALAVRMLLARAACLALARQMGSDRRRPRANAPPSAGKSWRPCFQRARHAFRSRFASALQAKAAPGAPGNGAFGWRLRRGYRTSGVWSFRRCITKIMYSALREPEGLHNWGYASIRGMAGYAGLVGKSWMTPLHFEVE